jgi:hypothetical protein
MNVRVSYVCACKFVVCARVYVCVGNAYLACFADACLENTGQIVEGECRASWRAHRIWSVCASH